MMAFNSSPAVKTIRTANGRTFSKNISYLQMDAGNEADYQKIAEIVKQKEQEYGEHPNVIFYMSVAPHLVPQIASKLGRFKYLQRYKMHPHCG